MLGWQSWSLPVSFLLAPSASTRSSVVLDAFASLDDRSYWIERYQRVAWRQRLWNEDAALSFIPSTSVLATDQETLCYIAGRPGYLATAVSPGMLVFYPEIPNAGATYFLRTGFSVRPSAFRAFGSRALLGFADGSVQEWDWQTQLLCSELRNVSVAPVTAMDQSETWDLLAVGSEDAAISLWRRSTGELLQTLLEVAPGIRNGQVKKVCFVERLELLCGEGNEQTYREQRLFLVALFEVQSVSFMFGTKRRSLCNVVVWEMDPWTGMLGAQLYSRNTVWGQEAVKDSLEINEVDGTVLFLTTTDDCRSANIEETDDSKGQTVYLHELEPLSGSETICPLNCYSSEEELNSRVENASVREWQLLGVGRRFAAVCVWEVARSAVGSGSGSGSAATTPSTSLLIFERRDSPNPSQTITSAVAWTAAPILTHSYWSSLNFQSPLPVDQLRFLSAICLGSKKW